MATKENIKNGMFLRFISGSDKKERLVMALPQSSKSSKDKDCFEGVVIRSDFDGEYPGQISDTLGCSFHETVQATITITAE